MALVKIIFERYIELKSVGRLKEYLNDNKIYSRTGKPLSKGNLHHILVNRVYIGEVGHKGIWYKGEAEGITPIDVFDKAQEILANNQRNRENITAEKSLLSGKLFDDKGNYMSPSHSRGRHKKKYRYYVSQAIIRKEKDKIGKITKISAPQIEQFVENEIKSFIQDEQKIQLLIKDLSIIEQKETLKQFKNKLINGELTRSFIDKIHLTEAEVKINLNTKLIKEFILNRKISEYLPFIQIITPYKVGIVDNGARIIIGKEIKNTENQAVIKSILTAHRWSKMLLNGEAKSVAEIAQKEKLMPGYVSRILNLAFLPPKCSLNILENKEKDILTLEKLLKIASAFSTSKLVKRE